MKTLEEVKSQIEPVVKQQKAQQAAQKQAEDLLQQAKTQDWTRPGGEGRGGCDLGLFQPQGCGAGSGSGAAVDGCGVHAAEKSPADMAATSQGFAVFQLLAVQPPSTPTFEEIRTKVEEQFKNERANILLAQKTQELSDRAKSEHDLKKAAKELGATMKSSDFVAPDGRFPILGR